MKIINTNIDFVFHVVFLAVVLIWFYYAVKLKSIEQNSIVWSMHLLGVLLLIVGAVLNFFNETHERCFSEAFISAGILMSIIAVRHLIVQQMKLTQNLQRETATDYLTGVGNRRYLDEIWPAILNTAVPGNTSIAVLLLDLDNFKVLNDRYGHTYGDRVLSLMVKALRLSLRDSDHIVRYGGDEFILILPGVNRNKAGEIKARVIGVIEQVQLPGSEKIQVSCGAAVYPEDGRDLKRLIEIADQRMYRHKSDKKQ
ncbi:diguanylate cyclase (GGDEF)-like protein [Desulfohalotomaculum tongense]|uniref:GGDEF domain-containing protein n=1 Tax=Desulforadius tongensis TaxID=1216062 RepID=UPI00195A9920|nr:GGDEF domain-containing protein [Desulforadius tongensis]MBM7854380.1 diguanylate cyclase (GGDEF)-like protein [Desulforadius tongensis]